MPRLPDWLQEALADYAQRVRAALTDRVLDVRLFGSWARGEAKQHSDIDVLVIVTGHDEDTRRAPYEACIHVLLEREVQVSPVVMDKAEWDHLVGRERRLALDIQRDGVAL